MYSISGFRKRSDLRQSEAEARTEYDRVLALASVLGGFHTAFGDFTFRDEEAQRRYAEIGDEILKMDVPSDDILAELAELDAQKKLPVRGNEDRHFQAIWNTNRALNAAHGSGLLYIELKGDQKHPATIKSTLDFQSERLGSIDISLPMQNDDDFWFADFAKMRDMMFAAMDIWDIEWIVAQPTMYTGLQKNLFPDRRSFGWMGWMPEDLTDPGDALAMVEPYRGGTFLLLQERMMNMKAPDIAACNKAEAYLLDRGMLGLL